MPARKRPNPRGNHAESVERLGHSKAMAKAMAGGPATKTYSDTAPMAAAVRTLATT